VTASLFVGRERELARLREAFDAAREGEPRVVMLAGEPGIGKTRLAEELAEYAPGHGALVLWGRAQEFAGTPPYWPWVQMGRAYRAATPEETRREEWAPYAAELQRIFPGLRELFPDLPPPEPGETPDAQFRLFDAISGFLHAVSGRVPLLLVLDDLHWADRSTLLMLGHVARDLAGARLLLLGAYRDTDLDRTHPLAEVLAELNRERLFERIHLRGLNEEDVTAFVRGAANAVPGPDLLARIYEETEGNPFFLSEVVALLDAESALAGGDGVAAIAVPEGVREVLGRRLNRLSPETNALLTLAAVVGREFGEPLLAALSDRTGESLLESLEEAFTARVIEPTGEPGEYRFGHALMRETLLAELSPARRVRLHGQIAETLERLADAAAEQRAAELAAHYVEAAVLGRDHTEKAAHYSRLAAEEAQAQLAWAEAIRHYERCLELVTAHEDRLGQNEAPLWLELAVCELASVLEGRSFADMEGAILRAFALWPNDDPRGLARGLLRCLAMMPLTSMVRSFNPIIDEALTLLGPSPARETCELLALQAAAVFGPEGDRAAAQANAMARALGLTDEDHPFALRVRPALVARSAGRWTEASAMFEQLVGDAPSSAVDSLLINLMYAQWLAGHLERSELTARRLRERFRSNGSRRWEDILLAWLGWSQARRGPIGAARALLEEMSAATHDALAALVGPELALVFGDAKQALAELPAPSAPGWSDAPGWDFARAERLGMRCRMLALSGETEAARAAFQEWEAAFAQVPEQSSIAYLQSLHVLDDVLCAFAEDTLLHRIRDRLGAFPELRNWWAGGGPDYLRGAIELRLGDAEAAERWFATGLEWATGEGAPLVAGRCHQGLAAVAERRGDVATAREHLDAAVEQFTPIGAKLYLDQVQAALDALPEPASSRPRFPDGLTEREVEVLRLVAAGKSNREIAEELVISLNTVERHVNHIYTKAGLANRGEAATYAHRHELA
jgi:DNA-binding CsgD family transcriptional regulator